MTKKYKNKYRIESIRLQYWDYGWNAPYFVTICTKNRAHHFGDIVETQNFAPQQMQLSEIGKIAHSRWLEIPIHFPFIKLGKHIVMPNHVHGIIIIDKPSGVAINRDSTGFAPKPNPNPNPGGITGNKNPMLHDNLSRVMRWYKGRVTFESRQINPDFAWQSRFHDHIIRNNRAYQNISKYIINNPAKWQGDRFRIKQRRD